MKIRTVELCEHVRFEVGGKLTCCGLFGGGIWVSQVPIALPLVCVVQVEDASSAVPFESTIEVQHAGRLIYGSRIALPACPTNGHTIVHQIQSLALPALGLYTVVAQLSRGGEILALFKRELEISMQGAIAPSVFTN